MSENLDASIIDEQRAWRTPESLDFYRRHRQRVEDLYPSERLFMPVVVRQVQSMLDVGCAAGGFSAVAKAFNPAIRYVGVDVVPEFVAAARIDHPDAEFIVGDGVTYPTPESSFDLVHSSGVLHLNLRFVDIIRAMWRQTNRFLLCDLRLTLGAGEVGRMESPFGEARPVPLPYVVLEVEQALDLFRRLDPRPSSIHVKGYPQRASAAAVLLNSDIIMACFLVEKGRDSLETQVDVDLHVR